MSELRVDLETYSTFDLPKVGVYRYVESPDFEIMLFGYKWTSPKGFPLPAKALDWLTPRLRQGFTKADVQVYARRCIDVLDDVDDHPLAAVYPPGLIRALVDPKVIKNAANANFERTCLKAWLGLDMPPEQWRCTLVKALYCGLPGDLFRIGQVLRLKSQKMAGGKSLIHYFCKPCKPTKKNGGRTRNLPHHDPAKWALFKTYCAVDVDSEEEVDTRVSKVPMPDVEWRAWAQDQRMNDRGVRVNRPLVEAAVKVGVAAKSKLLQQARELTGLSNPNSVQQLVKWLNDEIEPLATGVPAVAALNKKTMPLIQNLAMPGSDAAKLIELRQRMAKASVAKYDAALRSICNDDRLRGVVQFYGANRTGRWAGRLVQVHNMVKTMFSFFKGLYPDMSPTEALACARRALIGSADAEALELLFDDPMQLLAQFGRTMFEPADGMMYGPVDFSAIEARALAWKAKEKWRLDVFRGDGRIYEASAAQMFKVPLASITKGSPMRQKGKVAELALGYGGGEGALIVMGALDMGLALSELDPLKKLWRASNPHITQLWWDTGDAAMLCVRTGKRQDAHGIGFRMHCGMLLMRLDSGRELCYVRPKVEEGTYGDEVTYEGMDQVTKQWVRISSYGPKWIENWDQAFCRDLLRDKLLRMEDEGLDHLIDFHVHDEVVPRVPDRATLEKIERIFAEPVPWAPGLPLRGDGYLTPFYVKDDD